MKTMITSSLLLLLAAISLLLNNNAAAASKDSSSATAAITNNVDVTIATELSAATDDDTNTNANTILAALTAQTNKTTQSLSQKSAEYTKLQSLLSDKLAILRERQSSLQAELSNDNDVDSTARYVMGSTEAVHESMDDVSLKLLALIQRTEDVMRRVGQFNRAELLGSSDGSNNNDNNYSGLQERLTNVKKDEIERRDRFLMTTQQQQESSGDHDDSSSLDDESHTTSAADVKNDYMTITQLDQLLSTTNILTPSENELKSKLTALAMNMMEQRTSNDADFWKNHFATLPRTIQEHVQHQRHQQVLAKSNDGECIQIPSAVQLVANALALHYQDGGVGMMDVASYENGGSVVYELTSSPYQPSPRNSHVGQADEREFGVDKATERMYHEQQHSNMMMMGGESGGGIAQKIDTEIDKIDIWNWYTNFKMDSIRKYLPNDWERALDRLSSSGYLGTSTNNWGEYTPRGIVDALIPDYIYHAFGISNTASYGSVYGRTASPEVAITAGYSKVGGGAVGGGWSAKALGNCYPLSMRPENDPVLSLLSRGAHSMGAEDMDDEEESSISSLVGPKYTVRLPYPIHIDAVSVEHRAFPLPQRVLTDGVRGGESAPRWVKVVGFPPCDDGNGNLIEADEEECDKLGFDISQPIELGSFEYHPVTVSGREDDYGGGDVEETSSSDSDRRRRSIQTFTVKGGKVKESDMEEEGSDDDILGSDEPGLEVEDYEIPAGSCAPPKEPDDVPSCGGDTSSSSDESERQVVSAVSFIIEENWGNNDYTCLYRVRVHGEPISI
eukprot:scaffold2282_cov77-Skeletonema_dohrnii-CCMP3373.AAC.3